MQAYIRTGMPSGKQEVIKLMKSFLGNKTVIFVFVFPMLFLFSIFVIFPIIPSITISLQDNNGFTSRGYVGLANYLDVLKDNDFWHSNFNNIKIILMELFVGLPVSFILALLLDAQLPGIKRFFKMSSFMPAVLSVTVISQMWIGIYEPQWGLLNSLLKVVGLGSLTREWLSDESTALVSVAVAFLWQFIGFNMLLFYTGLKSIPKTYYEASLIDGASYLQSTIKITIPLLQEITKFLLLISILGSMAQFAHVRIMTGGGPGGASTTVVYYLYNQAFTASDFGKGSAISVLFVIECLIITFIINQTVAKEKIQY